MGRKPARLRPFAGVDGEEGTYRPGQREYLLLRAGGSVLHTGEPLGWEQCFPFLCSLPAIREYVAYFFNYDVTMMCRRLPVGVVEELLDRDSRALPDNRGTAPVAYRGFEFDWLPSKEFKIRRQLANHQKTPWITVSDVGTFFQCSFLKAITVWGIGTAEEHAEIEAGKALRADFVEMEGLVAHYNELECRLLEQLMEAFRDVCVGIGYIPKRWQGPGNLAASMFEQHGVPRQDAIPTPEGLWGMAQAAYYGGRFETTAHGWVGR